MKGAVLTAVADFWFAKLGHIVPNQLTGVDPESVVAPDERDQVRGRAVVVKRLKPLPIEAVVRGLRHRLWLEGLPGHRRHLRHCPASGSQNGRRLPSPIFTGHQSRRRRPRRKYLFRQGPVQLRCHPGGAVASSGKERRRALCQARTAALALYEAAASRAAAAASSSPTPSLNSGSILPALCISSTRALTPDSSRFWPADQYREGSNPPPSISGSFATILKPWTGIRRLRALACRAKSSPRPLRNISGLRTPSQEDAVISPENPARGAWSNGQFFGRSQHGARVSIRPSPARRAARRPRPPRGLALSRLAGPQANPFLAWPMAALRTLRRCDPARPSPPPTFHRRHLRLRPGRSDSRCRAAAFAAASDGQHPSFLDSLPRLWKGPSPGSFRPGRRTSRFLLGTHFRGHVCGSRRHFGNRHHPFHRPDRPSPASIAASSQPGSSSAPSSRSSRLR